MSKSTRTTPDLLLAVIIPTRDRVGILPKYASILLRRSSRPSVERDAHPEPNQNQKCIFRSSPQPSDLLQHSTPAPVYFFKLSKDPSTASTILQSTGSSLSSPAPQNTKPPKKNAKWINDNLRRNPLSSPSYASYSSAF